MASLVRVAPTRRSGVIRARDRAYPPSRRRCGRVPRAGVVSSSVPRAAGQSGYLRGTRFVYTPPDDDHHVPGRSTSPPSSPTPRARSSASSRDRDPSTHGLYEMVRYHLALDGSGASGGKRMRPLLGLLAYATITGEHQRALPGAAAVELGHNFCLVHDDIEDGDIERRHRPTLWTVHGVPQAINTGDTLFSLSRIALHRLTDLGFPDAKVLRLMRLYDETCLALCEGQYLDIAMSASDELDERRPLLRHDRAQDGGPHRRLDRGRRAARDRGRRGHRPLPRLRLGARARLPAQRRPARHLGPGTGDRQGTVRRRPPQEDAAGHLRLRARRPRGPRAPGASSTPTPDPTAAEVAEVIGDPRADRRPRLHPRPGAPLPRRGARRARRGRVVEARRRGTARGDHRRR